MWVRNLVSVKGDPNEGGRRLRGVVIDISNQRQAEREREDLLTEVQRERSLLRAAFDQLPEGKYLVTAEGQVVIFNRALAQVLNVRPAPGLARGQSDGLECFFPDGRPYTAAAWPIARALASGQPVEGSEIEFLAADGVRRTIVVDATPVIDEAGKVVACVSSVSDVTERKRLEALQGMLVDAGSILAGSRDGITIARSIAAIAARQFADWAAIFTATEEGDLTCVALEHRDPARAVPTAAFDRLLGQPGGAPFRVRSVVVSGQPELLSVLDPDSYDRGALQADLVRLVRSMGAESAITVPLTSPTRVLGAMVFGQRRAAALPGQPGPGRPGAGAAGGAEPGERPPVRRFAAGGPAPRGVPVDRRPRAEDAAGQPAPDGADHRRASDAAPAGPRGAARPGSRRATGSSGGWIG